MLLLWRIILKTELVTAFTNAESFATAQRMAQLLCSSTMVPSQYRGEANIGNTLVALEIAQRINASPLMVLQNLYIVNGSPSWSSKFLIATFNQSGRFTAIRYEWKGEPGKKDRGCRAFAIEHATGERVEGPWIDWVLIDAEGWALKTDKKGNLVSKWLSNPEKMFAYRAAAWMIDLVAPELSMGLTPEDQAVEMPIVDITPRGKPSASLARSIEVDVNGEIWSEVLHVERVNGRPVLMSDGSFEKREEPVVAHQLGD